MFPASWWERVTPQSETEWGPAAARARVWFGQRLADVTCSENAFAHAFVDCFSSWRQGIPFTRVKNGQIILKASTFSIFTSPSGIGSKNTKMANDSCSLPLDTDIFGLTCIYSVIFSLGLPSNLLSLWGLYHLGRSGGGGCQLVYILNLLLSDLLQLLTLPLWILYLQGAHRWPYGQLPCELVGYVFYVNVYASVMFLCLIALDRFLAIVYPLSSRRVRTVRVAAVCGVVVWMLTFLFCLSGLLPSVFDPDRLLCLEQYPVSPGYAYFKITTVALGFLLPCAILG